MQANADTLYLSADTDSSRTRMMLTDDMTVSTRAGIHGYASKILLSLSKSHGLHLWTILLYHTMQDWTPCRFYIVYLILTINLFRIKETLELTAR